MKTLKEFFNSYSSNPHLHKKVWRQGEVDWASYKECPSDYYDAGSGSVTGMIYYEDTVRFAKRNIEDILEQLRESEREYGCSFNVPIKHESETQYYNWLAWFAWEQMAGELQSYVEG